MLSALAALLVFVAASTLAALALVLPTHRGLDGLLAVASLGIGVAAGAGAWWQVRRREQIGQPLRVRRALSPWAWLLVAVFALFALRSFCWLVYPDDKQLAIGSQDNLGDLSLHMQMAQYFANGVTWWPAHPEAAGYSLRYYPGIDLFESLLLLVGADNLHVLVWMGLVGSAAALLALFRWGGSFTVAGFLFSGGLAGFQFFRAFELADYQHPLGWKSLPLTMFVTQRPFLFALPAGLLLLIHWRQKFFADPPPTPQVAADSLPPPLATRAGCAAVLGGGAVLRGDADFPPVRVRVPFVAVGMVVRRVSRADDPALAPFEVGQRGGGTGGVPDRADDRQFFRDAWGGPPRVGLDEPLSGP